VGGKGGDFMLSNLVEINDCNSNNIIVDFDDLVIGAGFVCNGQLMIKTEPLICKKENIKSRYNAFSISANKNIIMDGHQTVEPANINVGWEYIKEGELDE
jgi:hypothetical protein